MAVPVKTPERLTILDPRGHRTDAVANPRRGPSGSCPCPDFGPTSSASCNLGSGLGLRAQGSRVWGSSI